MDSDKAVEMQCVCELCGGKAEGVYVTTNNGERVGEVYNVCTDCYCELVFGASPVPFALTA